MTVNSKALRAEQEVPFERESVLQAVIILAGGFEYLYVGSINHRWHDTFKALWESGAFDERVLAQRTSYRAAFGSASRSLMASTMVCPLRPCFSCYCLVRF